LIVEAHSLNKEIGSTTCCMVSIEDEKNLINAANIGDSGYVIYRKENDKIVLVHESVEM